MLEKEDTAMAGGERPNLALQGMKRSSFPRADCAEHKCGMKCHAAAIAVLNFHFWAFRNGASHKM